MVRCSEENFDSNFIDHFKNNINNLKLLDEEEDSIDISDVQQDFSNTTNINNKNLKQDSKKKSHKKTYDNLDTSQIACDPQNLNNNFLNEIFNVTNH